MGNVFQKLWKQHTFLVLCVGVSAFLLLLFFRLQYDGSPILGLKSQWLIVAGVPLLLGIIAGGYVKTFKGFGMEFETLLRTPVRSVAVQVREVVAFPKSRAKESISRLDSMSISDRAGVGRLSFVLGLKNYYEESSIQEYLLRLPNVEYFEITRPTGEFYALVPVEHFRVSRRFDESISLDFNSEAIDQFTNALKESAFNVGLPFRYVTFQVMPDQDCIDVLRKLRASDLSVAAVVAPDGGLVGVARARDIERKIADAVLSAVEA
ncbi:MAG: CBS domain-containing protein [Burkholderiaceae bacterium]